MCLFISADGLSSSIYEYDGLTEEWLLKPEFRLEEGREFFATTFALGENMQCRD